jgi:hypothetical protein
LSFVFHNSFKENVMSKEKAKVKASKVVGHSTDPAEVSCCCANSIAALAEAAAEMHSRCCCTGMENPALEEVLCALEQEVACLKSCCGCVPDDNSGGGDEE